MLISIITTLTRMLSLLRSLTTSTTKRKGTALSFVASCRGGDVSYINEILDYLVVKLPNKFRERHSTRKGRCKIHPLHGYGYYCVQPGSSKTTERIGANNFEVTLSRGQRMTRYRLSRFGYAGTSRNRKEGTFVSVSFIVIGLLGKDSEDR